MQKPEESLVLVKTKWWEKLTSKTGEQTKQTLLWLTESQTLTKRKIRIHFNLADPVAGSR